jgi:hypothetical protein
LPFTVALGLAGAGEAAVHTHLNAYDWFVAITCALVIAAIVVAPILLLTPYLLARKRRTPRVVALSWLGLPVLEMSRPWRSCRGVSSPFSCWAYPLRASSPS